MGFIKNIFSNIKYYVICAFVVITALLTAYTKGKKSGVTETKEKIQKETAEHLNKSVKEAKNEQIKVDSTSDSDVVNELNAKWMRKQSKNDDN